ncbi:HK97 family phage prohead protease [Epibacterium sp. SM1979]|uniref:HK97 family phage prohead protease n=1 Tax=Tritonibacter litoralis TaxID=2662264 RepID=A0A843YDJ4_9RHOB|nr:HK97 family phage prohead protease [Tritonibacter litoralis]MQQ06947.1 HK97 family phage prohead protease [Tritonibacter litoralis]
MRFDPNLEVKFAENPAPITLTEGARIQGYASRFGEVDQGGDQVMPGAYTEALERLNAQGRRVKMLWQHDPSQPIGVWDELHEDQTGLFVSGRLLTETRQGAEAAALIAAGAIDGLSIGYRTTKSARSETGTRQLLALDLWEVSLVTFPMLPSARVAAPKTKTNQLNTLAAALRQATAQLKRQSTEETP